jgi:hypothetical protein
VLEQARDRHVIEQRVYALQDARVMHLDLSDEEAAALTKQLDDITRNDRCPFSERIRKLKATPRKVQTRAGPGTLVATEGVCAAASNNRRNTARGSPMTTESWLFLFAAIPVAGTLLTFFRIDALTIARLWQGSTSQGAPRQYTGRDIIISIFIVLSLVFSGLGLALTIGQGPPHLSDTQKRKLLASAGPMRTFLSSIVISATNGDPETEPLAHDIASVFNRAGIEPVFSYTRPDNPDQSGVIICIKDLNKPPMGIEELKAALKASDIHFKVQSFPPKGFPGINTDIPLVIWVAPAQL